MEELVSLEAVIEHPELDGRQESEGQAEKASFLFQSTIHADHVDVVLSVVGVVMSAVEP